MRMSNAALGLAAMGAGWLVVRALLGQRPDNARPATEPPSPNQLIGTNQSHLSAAEAADVFRLGRERPV